ncbi:YicC/YloC family endoribonuclease [Acetanaerobacterium elongatum]|uniref:TIGR00255 family protein n=1 Tax=Acetanaerobacterium elongatum TaxID=258515 RepID=A0A1G9VP88_9FIRM|nr:YicC/YloC family endoribonuclease [Acetanaerobacterium elongatum]SDM73920.1 TIGR00255 family protein [Acetanaerobacterium elongatum]
MIRSMTGYGRAQQQIDGRDIQVEIKAVNHRFFEFSARTPRAYGFLEEKMKSFVQERVSRGKVEASVTVITLEGSDAKVEVNAELAASYVKALREIGIKLDVKDDLSLTSLIQFPDIFAVHKELPEEEVIWNSVKTVAEQAIDAFVKMREIEGVKLKEDILSRLSFIEQAVKTVEERSPQTIKEYRERLYAKMKEVLEDKNIDESRLITEAAIFADRVAVDEETVRLKSHIAQFSSLLGEGGQAGRKLDFLVQELNREANTIGSKAQDVEIAKTVVAIKAEIEKIREQIQNIE